MGMALLYADPRKIVEQVHKLCQASAERILNEFRPNLMIAIGGGGYVPARILRYATPICRQCILLGCRLFFCFVVLSPLRNFCCPRCELGRSAYWISFPRPQILS